MRLKYALFGVLAVLLLTEPSYAIETWHTLSGKAYDVYTSVKVGKKGKKSQYFIISYKTETDLKNSYQLLLEHYDLVTQLYYFHLPKQLKNDKFSLVTTEAFRKAPKSRKDKVPSKRFTAKLSDLRKIAKRHKKIDKNRLKAFLWYEKRRLSHAVKSFKKIKKKVAHDYIRMSKALIILDKEPQALKILQTAEKKFPKNVSILNNLAMTTMLMGTFVLEGKYEFDPEQIKKAKEIILRAKKLDPKNWRTLSNIAALEAYAGNRTKAEKILKEMLTLSRGHEDVHYQIGELYHRQKKFKQAREHYKKALNKLKSPRSLASEGEKEHREQQITTRLKLVDQNKSLK